VPQKQKKAKDLLKKTHRRNVGISKKVVRSRGTNVRKVIMTGVSTLCWEHVTL
jgi:hypothetical protein